MNQYSAVGSASPSYDLNGNLTSDGLYTYAYDIENRWLGTTSGPKSVTLAYDPAGRLRQTIGSETGTTGFLYDGDALVAEYNASGALIRRYVHGPGVDAPILWYEGSTTSDRRFLHANDQGSIIAVSNSSGTTTETHAYGPYGEPQSLTGSRFRYTGQILIPELGLYHYKARAYAPKWGRFLQTDPIGYDDNNNLYAYTGNDPVNHTDPTGQQECDDQGNCTGFVRNRPSFFETTAASNKKANSSNNGAKDASEEKSRDAFVAPAATTASAATSSFWARFASLLRRSPLILMANALVGGQRELGSGYAHYTTEEGRMGILASGQVLPSNDGNVYATKQFYGSGSSAQESLALSRTPSGFFWIPKENFSNIGGPFIVAPTQSQLGGGLEWKNLGPVPIAGAKWVPID